MTDLCAYAKDGLRIKMCTCMQCNAMCNTCPQHNSKYYICHFTHLLIPNSYLKNIILIASFMYCTALSGAHKCISCNCSFPKSQTNVHVAQHKALGQVPICLFIETCQLSQYNDIIWQWREWPIHWQALWSESSQFVTQSMHSRLQFIFTNSSVPS